MVFFFRGKKKQQKPVRVLPTSGLEGALKSKYMLDMLKVRLSQTQLPGWGVKDIDGKVKETDASKMFRQDVVASMFHGEIGDKFPMSKESHKAYSRLYRKWLHAQTEYGSEHIYTKTLEKMIFYAYVLCLPRTVKREDTAPQVVTFPLEMMVPGMNPMWGRSDNLGIVRPGAAQPQKDSEEEETEE